MRTIFLGSGGFGRESLRRLSEHEVIDLVGVVTAPGSVVQGLADELGIDAGPDPCAPARPGIARETSRSSSPSCWSSPTTGRSSRPNCST